MLHVSLAVLNLLQVALGGHGVQLKKELTNKQRYNYDYNVIILLLSL